MKDVKEPGETRGGRRPRLATTWRRSTVRTSGDNEELENPNKLLPVYRLLFCVLCGARNYAENQFGKLCVSVLCCDLQLIVSFA